MVRSCMATLRGVKTQSFDEGADLDGVKTWHFDEMPRLGGGRGRYATLDGDYPVASLRGGAMIQTSAEGHQMTKLRLMLKNVMSIQGENRLTELMEELRSTERTVAMLTETWLECKEEIWKTNDGHMFMGSGGQKGTRGVTIILHRRLVAGWKAFHAIDERVCAVDLDFNGVRFRWAYMPHGGYGDDAVESVYARLDNLCDNAKKL